MELINDRYDNRYDGFCNFCSLIDNNNINNFRSNNYFKSIVENVHILYGSQYYKLITEKYNDIIDKINWGKIEKLSNIGNPDKNYYFFNEKKYIFTPTILRYILFTLNMLSHIKNNTNIKELNIIEIGGGFGFQSILLKEMINIFDLKLNKYTIIDLKSVCNLQNIFINKCKEIDETDYDNLGSMTFDNFNLDDDNYNFVISNYALGELNTVWQNTYINNIISKVEHGYFCWNFSPSNPNIHSYFTNKDIIKEEEEPQTNCAPIKSYILRY